MVFRQIISIPNRIKKEKSYSFNSLLTSQSAAYKTLITIKQHNYENPDANEKVPNEYGKHCFRK